MSSSPSSKARVLCLDFGERRIGVAISGGGCMLATPYTVILRRSQEQAIAAVLEIVRAEKVGCIVVGLPISLDNSVGPQAERTLSFYEALKAASPVPVETWDERFSTVEAERLLREAGVRPKRRKGRLDASAAAVVLQAYLDAHRAAAE